MVCALLAACGGGPVSGPAKKFLSAEDNAVIELLEAIKKSPTDKSLQDLLEPTYRRAMESRSSMKGYVLRDNPPGDRWVLWRRQLEASQAITDLIMSDARLVSLLTNAVQFRDEISEAKQKAAEEFYDAGMDLLRRGTRQEARRAMDLLSKANREIPAFKDVAIQLRRAEELATLFVVVNPVDYYSFSWNYWGFQNDYLQWQMLRDLNNRSFRMTRFLSEQEARSRNIVPERVVDMRFSTLNVGNPYTDRHTYQREKQITVQEPPPSRPPAAGTKPAPKPPEVITVRATVTHIKRYITGNADLQCRIYDVPTGRNILFDRFPGRYNWVFESATYTGDQRALTDEDRRLLNNRFDKYPTREEVGRKLIEDAYGALVRRIEQGVNFDNW